MLNVPLKLCTSQPQRAIHVHITQLRPSLALDKVHLVEQLLAHVPMGCQRVPSAFVRGLGLPDGQGKFRVMVRIRVRVGFGLWL